MTLEELLTDLRAAGANENTIRLAMNCYELGRVNEREACVKECDNASHLGIAAQHCAEAIRRRSQA